MQTLAELLDSLDGAGIVYTDPDLVRDRLATLGLNLTSTILTDPQMRQVLGALEAGEGLADIVEGEAERARRISRAADIMREALGPEGVE